MLDLLGACIHVSVREGFETRREAADYAFGFLTFPSVRAHVTALASIQLKLPLATDKGFREHMQP